MDNRKRLKQLANEYAHTHRRMGIFQLRNKESGTSFVNSSMDLDAVMNRLRVQLDTGTFFMDRKLQQEWTEQGSEAFEMIELEVIKPEEDYLNHDDDRRKYAPILKKKLEKWKAELKEQDNS